MRGRNKNTLHAVNKHLFTEQVIYIDSHPSPAVQDQRQLVLGGIKVLLFFICNFMSFVI
jgi:hypothetical protein